MLRNVNHELDLLQMCQKLVMQRSDIYGDISVSINNTQIVTNKCLVYLAFPELGSFLASSDIILIPNIPEFHAIINDISIDKPQSSDSDAKVELEQGTSPIGCIYNQAGDCETNTKTNKLRRGT